MGIGTFTLALKDCISLTGGTVELEEMEFNGVPMGGIQKLTGGNIGVGHMPIFDESYKDILTGKIIDRFWNREIGFESLDVFQMKMRVKLNEIMPFYNQLYKSTEIPYEALSTINLKTESESRNTGTENSAGNSTSTQTTNGESRAVQSTTPQTMLSGDEDYASSAADTRSLSAGESGSENTAEATSTGEATGDTLVTGYQGTPADLIMRFRDSLLNVDLMVLRDLEELFMQVFDNGDSYTNNLRGYWL